MSSVTYGETLLKIDNVSLEYDHRPILRNVNAEIRNIHSDGRVTGQVVGILGPSGVGKTQTFRIIAGLNQPTSGAVTVTSAGRPVHPGDIGVVAQNYPLFAHRTVFSNLLLAASKKEQNSKIAGDKVMEFLREFDLADKRYLYPSQLSGGQRQRCAIIQQVLCSEHFLLMDEPFASLDLLMIEKTTHLIDQIASMDELNTVIVISHDVTAVCSIADHVWLLGRDSDPDGNKLPGARIIKEYNLIDLDLCWHSEIITQPRFMNFVAEVKEEFRRL